MKLSNISSRITSSSAMKFRILEERDNPLPREGTAPPHTLLVEGGCMEGLSPSSPALDPLLFSVNSHSGQTCVLLRLTAWRNLMETQSLQFVVYWCTGVESSSPRLLSSWWNHTWWWWRRYLSAVQPSPSHDSSDQLCIHNNISIIIMSSLQFILQQIILGGCHWRLPWRDES